MPELIHLKLTIAYDGTGLVGWQRQPTGTSIQALLEDALGPLEGGPVTVTGAGRTDAGVHALGQVASVTLRRTIAPHSVVKAANMAMEGVARRDFSTRMKEKMLLAGFVVLMTLMVTVIYNDLTRISWIERMMPWRN